MKKVLFVATVVKLHIMVFHIPYLEWFKKNGYEVHVAAYNDYKDKEECEIPFCDKFFDLPFERSPMKKNNLFVYKELKNIIDNNEYDIIHCHTPMGGALGRLASHNTRNIGTKLIYTAHGFHFFKGAPFMNWLVYYPVERWLAKYTDILITINKEDYDRAKNFKAGTIKYIPGVGIDTNKFKNNKVNNEEKRKSLGIGEKDFMIISVGELNKNKNHQVIIKAINRLKNENIKYVICGQGPLEIELKELTNKLGMEKQIKFLGFRKDIPELMRISDLFAFPSYREGLSLSLMEAMASGLPVLCSSIRGNIDLIDEGLGGYLVNPNDVNYISKKINTLSTCDNRKKLGLFNLEKINKFNRNNILKLMTSVYEDG